MKLETPYTDALYFLERFNEFEISVRNDEKLKGIFTDVLSPLFEDFKEILHLNIEDLGEQYMEFMEDDIEDLFLSRQEKEQD